MREVYPGIRTSLDVTRGSGQAASHRREVGGVDRSREVYPGIRTSLDVTRGSGQAASHRREVGGVDRWREVYPGIRTSLDVTRGSGQAASHRREVGGVDSLRRYIQEFALRLMSRCPGPTWVQRWVPTCVADRVSTDRGEADPTGCPC